MGFRKKIEDTPFWGLYFILIISFWTILEERVPLSYPAPPPPPVFIYELKDKQLVYQTKINISIHFCFFYIERKTNIFETKKDGRHLPYFPSKKVSSGLNLIEFGAPNQRKNIGEMKLTW
jgi:hypothetical protein